MIKDPNQFKNKTVIIAGGGDSALDWSIYLSEIADKVILVHRRNEFRGANDSVSSVQKLKNSGKIDVITPAQITKLSGSNKFCLLYTSPSPRDRTRSRMPSSA